MGRYRQLLELVEDLQRTQAKLTENVTLLTELVISERALSFARSKNRARVEQGRPFTNEGDGQKTRLPEDR